MKFSVIIPAYNCSEYIERSVKSVAEQRYEDKEVIVIDDGSKDDTLARARKLEAQYPCVKVLTQPNAGVSATRNRGMDIAQGEYIIFVDADDELNDGALDTLAQHADKRYDIIYYDFVYSWKKKIMRRSLKGFSKGTFHDEMDNTYLVRHIYNSCAPNWNFIAAFVTTSCYSTQFIRKHDLRFNTSITMAEDATFNLDMLSHNPRTGYLSVPLYTHYYENRGSLSNAFRANQFHVFQKSLETLNNIATNQYPDDSNVQEGLLLWAWTYIIKVVWLAAMRGTFDDLSANMKRLEESELMSMPLKHHLPPGTFKYTPYYSLVFWGIKHKHKKGIYRTAQFLKALIGKQKK